MEMSTGRYRFMKASIKPIWYDEWDFNDTSEYYNPVLVSCTIPLFERTVAVSIASQPCEVKKNPTFSLQSVSKDVKRDFTVCVKPLDFREDITHHLIQWIEVLKLLGADRIEFYVKKLNIGTRKVLKWLVFTFHIHYF